VGDGFAPKAIILWATPQTADGAAAASASFGMGMGTYRSSAVSMGYVTYFSADAGGSSVVARGMNTTSLLRLFSDGTTPTVDLEINLTSMDDNGVTISWVNLHTTASIRVHYMILGGSDITDALVHTYTLATSTATQDVTVASGFGKPDLFLFMGSPQTSLGDTALTCTLFLGAGNAAGEIFSAAMGDEDAANAMVMGGINKAALVTLRHSAVGTIDADATLSAYGSWPTDGYRLSYSDQANNAYHVLGLALRGTFTSKVTSVDAPTSTGDTDATLAGGTAKGALCFATTGPGTAATTDTTSSNLGAFNLGAFDSDSEAYAGAGNDDADGNADTGVSNSTAKAFHHLKTDTTPANLTAADGVLTGSTARLSWTTVDSAQHRVGVLVLGEVAVVDQIPNLVTARRV
jgi:hypothetical protein